MKKSSKVFLEDLSHFCYVKKSSYIFNSPTLKNNPKFNKGKLSVYKWMDELCFYFLQKEKNIKTDLYDIMNEKYVLIKDLQDGNYKDGLLEAFEEIYKHIQNIDSKS